MKTCHFRLKWNEISKYQKLSEPFIKEFSDKVHWANISKYQKLSENFIKEFHDKVFWRNMICNKTIMIQSTFRMYRIKKQHLIHLYRLKKAIVHDLITAFCLPPNVNHLSIFKNGGISYLNLKNNYL